MLPLPSVDSEEVFYNFATESWKKINESGSICIFSDLNSDGFCVILNSFQKMSVEENVKKSNFSLKRSVSSIGFGNSIQHNTNLRGTKSFTGIMALRISSQETKGTQMNDDNNANNNAGYCGEQEPSEDKVIETVDLITNEVISFKENILSYQGRTYLLGDISYKWKKDCRMWLWKNRPSMKQEIGDLRNNQSINITTLA